jgi:aldehyde:ferredoxin oxidoreductase
MCLFIAFATLEDPTCLPALIDRINARFGISLTAEDVTNLGMTILKNEHAFNRAAGFTNKDDRLPEFFSDEPIAPHNVAWDISDEEIDTF